MLYLFNVNTGLEDLGVDLGGEAAQINTKSTLFSLSRTDVI